MVTITHNIMCACDFDMKFTFVYMGWEGTANDSRVFLDALQRPENNFPWLPFGKIYCCLTYIFTIFKFNPFTMSYFSLSYYFLLGGYYLVDSSYPCTLGFLPPYRTERYHLQDF